MTRETRIQKLERLIAERAAESTSEKLARAMGHPRPKPDGDTPTTDASARLAARLGVGGDAHE